MLLIVFLTALGVGGTTMLGSLAGYCCRGATKRFSGEAVMSFAAGVMLSAAVVGLILPSLEGGGTWAVPVTTGGILCGAAFLLLLEQLVARMQLLSGFGSREEPEQAARANRVLLFVAAMAIHNLPEGMVLIAPMLQAGIAPRRTLLLAMSTGVVEIAGTLLGYFAVSFSAAMLPFLLAFAGGTMLYIICQDMIPDSGAHRGSVCALLLGFCFMLAMDYYLG